MKKLIYTLLFVLISVAANGQQAKYVFYFIGDGMGVNQVNGTETVSYTHLLRIPVHCHRLFPTPLQSG